MRSAAEAAPERAPRLRRRVDPSSPGAAVGIVAVLTLLVAAPYALAGANFILDDWYTLRNAHFDGAFAAAGPEQVLARPGAWLVYAFEFGVLGRRPLLVYAVQVALNLTAAVALLLLARRLWSPGRALCVASLWVLLPNHGSLRVWASAMNIVVALVLLLLGCLLLTGAPSSRSVTGVSLVLGLSVLTYEATLPAALLALVAVPQAAGRRWGGGHLAPPAAALVGAAGWVVLHWHPAKEDVGWADLGAVLPAHFGWGIAEEPASSVLLVVAVVAICVAVARSLLPSFRAGRTQADGMILLGLAVIAVGTLPFVRYFYAPLGAGDRVNVVASLGAAMAWTGIGSLLWHVRRSLAVVGGVAFAAGLVVTGVERDRLYARAGADVLLTLDLLDEAVPDPDGPIVLGPVPLLEGNVAGLLDPSNVDAALQLHRGNEAVHGYVTFGPEAFAEVPADRRFDHVAALRGGAPVRSP